MSVPEQAGIAEFCREVFQSMPRIDQKRWAEVYLTGLLAVPGKKSLRRISDTVVGQPAHQSLQQFLNQSPWEWSPVRESLARHICERVRPQAWVASLVVIPKRGPHSVGVERRFVRQHDRTISCQVGVGLFMATEELSIPVNWRILLSKRWDENHKLRSAVHLPRGVTSRPSWQETIDMAGELAGWGLPEAPIVTDMAAAQNAEPSLAALGALGLPFMAEVNGSLRVLPAGRGVQAAGRHRAGLRADEYLTGADSQRFGLRVGPSGESGAQVVFSTVRLRARRRGPGPARPVTLLGLRVPAQPRITGLWVTNIRGGGTDRILSLAGLLHRVRLKTSQLDLSYGLQDFEGRSFRGWHHHTTMVSAAATYDQLRREEFRG